MPGNATFNPYARRPEDALEPPKGFGPTLRYLGPGLIITGSIVGSGELITTTTLGATVGFVLLWWILFSCWVKSVFQAEFGRYIISSGETGLRALNRVPGKIGRVSWVVLLWLFLLIPFHLGVGGIYGGVGQAVALAVPEVDALVWTLLFAGVAIGLVLTGIYRLLETLLTFMVVIFTGITLACAILLQFTEYAVTWSDIRLGLSFDIPVYAIALALGAFGATGVSANENIAYTYWCTEKGYGRFAGPRAKDDAWAARARGWIKVLQTDVWLTLILLTLATIPFYMLGAAVLNQIGEVPDGLETIAILSNIYTETLGTWAFYLFLLGAFFVLFSTVISILGGSVRVMADAAIILGLVPEDDYAARLRAIRILTIVSPTIMITCYFFVQNPVWMVMIGGMFGAMNAPILAGSIIYLRYRHTDKRLTPGRLIDTLLWLCFTAMLCLALYIIYVRFLV